jgi:hypothetical protein
MQEKLVALDKNSCIGQVGKTHFSFSVVKAYYFLLIFGFMTCFVLWCPQPNLLFVKELGKLVING